MSLIETEKKMKSCGICKVEFENTLENFYGTGKIGKNGNKLLKSVCKKCHVARCSESRRKRVAMGIKPARSPYVYTPERREYMKKYNSDKEKVRERNRKAYLKRKEKKEAALREKALEEGTNNESNS